MRIIHVLLLLMILPLASCQDIMNSDSEILKEKVSNEVEYGKVLSKQTNNVIKPLKVGNLWNYKFYKYYEPEDDYVFLENYSLEVVERVEINDEVWFLMNDETPHSYTYLTNTDVGLLQNCNCPEDKYAEEWIIMKAQYPSSVGDEYLGESYPSIISENNETIELTTQMIRKLSSIEHIKINGRHYHCYKYITYKHLKTKDGELINRDIFFIDYYAPNIGLVKMDLYTKNLKNNTGKSIPDHILEIENYDLK